MPAHAVPLLDRIRQPRIVLLFLLAAVAVLVNLAGILSGYTAILSHLFYFPVILTAYWYPRRCYPYLIAMGLLYGAMVVGGYHPLDPEIIIVTALRGATFTLVGFVVSFLSYRLKDSEQQLYDVIEFLPDAAFAIDSRGVVVVWNRAMEDLTGVDRSEIIGRDNYEYALPFFGERRPVLVDMAMSADHSPGDWYGTISRGGDAFEAEIRIERLKEGKSAYLQFRAAPLRDHLGRVTGGVETIRDITDEVITGSALSKTTAKLNTITGMVLAGLSDRLSGLNETLDHAEMTLDRPDIVSFIEDVREIARGIQKLVTRTREFRDIGAQPPSWRRVIIDSNAAVAMLPLEGVRFRSWTERLEIFADSNLHCVFYHLFENSLNTGKVSSILVTYQIREDWCIVVVEDDGPGISPRDKEHLLEKSEGKESSRGLYVANEILSLTGMTLREAGVVGRGARFEIRVPLESYRVAGEEGVSGNEEKQVFAVRPFLKEVQDPVVIELRSEEFPIAEEIWKDYHELKGNPGTDRIFCVFCGFEAVSVARCRRHPDSFEVDGVFTPDRHRGRGYASLVVGALVEACHNEDLYMYSLRHLRDFYRRFGFRVVPEKDLPEKVRERYVWALGNLGGAGVEAMARMHTHSIPRGDAEDDR
ncbi:MAG: GNAT family N-acetyltransferase [Methanomicrobiales archaeon]